MKRPVWLFVCGAALLATAAAQGLPEAAPEQLGLSKERLARIRPAVESWIARNEISGATGLIVRRGKVAYFETYGLSDREAGKPVTKDSIFRIYSMTKAVTTVAAMTLYEEQQFLLSDPVSKFVPEFENAKVAVGKSVVSAERPITIRDLMRHTSGLDYGGPVDEKGERYYSRLGLDDLSRNGFDLAEMVRRIGSAPLVHQPGTTFDYSRSTDLLGRVVEIASGQPLDRFITQRILKPLHMDDTGYYVPEEKWGRLAVLYESHEGKLGRLQTNEQEGYKTRTNLVLGSSGLVSTAPDYARFLQMLLNGGELDGARILSPKTVELMRSDHLGDLPRVGSALPPGYGFGLGFAVNRGPGKTGAIGTAGECFWAGWAGTFYWFDAKEEMVGVFMTQKYADPVTLGNRFRQLAYQAIVGPPVTE